MPASAYTFRYLNADGTFSRVLYMQCAGDRDALRTAVDHLDESCAALEISDGERVVWNGFRADALAAIRAG